MSNNRPDVTWFHISLASSNASSAHICSQFHYISSAFLTVVIKAEHVSGAENGAERAENWAEQSGAWNGRDRKRWSGSRAQSGNGAGSGLNRPLTARSNLTFH